MKVSFAWIKEFTDITLDRDAMIARIGERLGAVEAIEDWGSYYDEAIVVAQIIEASDHPDADRLGLYKISTGSDEKQLVAGDKTLKVGDKVAYIPPGAAVPSSVKAGEPFVIAEREMRGIVSQGMLGSAAELIFSDNHEKVLVLDTQAHTGSSLKDAYKLDDIIIDIENKMFTHRPDCFGILGVAREIAGIQNISFVSPEWYTQAGSNLTSKEGDAVLPLTVENEVQDEVRRFSALVLSNITIKQSPLLMQSYLTRVGMRPINTVVDITNFMMHLTAQPMHAFDYDKVSALDPELDGAHIVVRKPHENEKLVLLDGREITPHSNAILIASKSKAMALGGCMGGSETEVDDTTRTIILEVANFDMYSIRRTSFINGVFTDAVSRFNKGQSLEQIDKVVSASVDMFVADASAQVASTYIDIYPSVQDNPEVHVRLEFINARLASQFSTEEIAALLRNVEFKVEVSGESFSIQAPFWRKDIHIPEDIVEEVGRLYGFDNLPIQLPNSSAIPRFPSDELQFAHTIRKILARSGANEVLSYNFTSQKEFSRSGLPMEHAYKIRNALAPNLEFMRTHILPSLLEKVNPNIRQKHATFALFEVGKTHSKQIVGADGLPEEQSRLSFVFASSADMHGAPFYQAKTYFEFLAQNINVNAIRFEPVEQTESLLGELQTLCDTKHSAFIYSGKTLIGIIGEPSPLATVQYKLPQSCAMFELDLEALQKQASTKLSYKKLSKFPGIEQDITFKVSAEINYSDIMNSIVGELDKTDLQTTVHVKSIYQPEGSAEKNISFTIACNNTEKTLKKEEINMLLDQISVVVADTISATRV